MINRELTKLWPLKNKNKLIKIFELEYPNPQSELNFINDYQLLISVILSAQCTDKKVNQVTPLLFKTYPSFVSLAKAELKKVENIIREVNYYRSKAKNIINTAKTITKNYKGELPLKRAELESLSGVGRKTASVVLSEKGIEPAFPVDTHVFRVSKRLGLAAEDKRDEVERELRDHFKPKMWRNMHHWLILHGRSTCKAQNPACSRCKINGLCPSYEKLR